MPHSEAHPDTRLFISTATQMLIAGGLASRSIDRARYETGDHAGDGQIDRERFLEHCPSEEKAAFELAVGVSNPSTREEEPAS